MPADTATRIERFVIATAVISIALALFGCRQATPVEHELSNDGKKLIVHTRMRIDADTGAREMRLVYDITTR